MINLWRSYSLFVLFGVAILSNACDRDSSTPTSRASSTAAPAATSYSPTPTTTLASVGDQSLIADQYITLGMPSYDRTWVGQDMATVASKLQVLARTAPEQLPRFNSSRSGPMFARIVARDNLDFFRARSLPLASRFPQALDYIDSLNAISKLYMSAFVAKKVTGDELVELMGAELRAAQVELELVDEFLPTLSKDDPKYPVRMEGLANMRQGLATVVVGNITTLTEARVYDAATRLKLVGYCRETFPSILSKLSAPSRAEVLRRLDEIVDDPRVRELRPQLVLLRDEANGAVKAGGAS